MKKRGLSIFLALVLCLSLLPTTTWAAGEDGTSDIETTADNWIDAADTDWYTSDTSASSFTITTAAELAGLAKLVNSGTTFSGKTITLGAKIDLSGKEWTPIGKYTNEYSDPAFQGTLDGGGHTVSGLCINITATSTTAAGLFGYVGTGGTVQNVNVEGTVTAKTSLGTLCVGGVVGCMSAAKVENCSFSGTVTGTGTGNADPRVGGVVGRAYGSTTVKNCSNSGAVTAKSQTASYAGGVVGNASGTSSSRVAVESCRNTGAVSNTSSTGYNGVSVHTGGVVGYTYYADVNNCYNTGAVESTHDSSSSSAANNTGGVVGTVTSNSTVNNCYNTGAVTGSGSGSAQQNTGGVAGKANSGTTVSSCYFLQGDIGSGLSSIGLNNGSTTEKVEAKTADQFASGEVAWLLSGGDTQDPDSPWRQNLGTNGDTAPTLDSTHARVVQAGTAYLNPLQQDTDGVYEISTAAELVWFANEVNGGKTTISGRLVDNIDLSSVCGADLGSWTPIGNSSNSFQGTFDGQDHTVSGLSINISTSASVKVYTGLFGYVYGGTVKNLNVSGTVTVKVTSSSSSSCYLHIGGVVGYNGEGTVENCSFNGSVSATLSSTQVRSISYIGGVVGNKYGGTVKNCCHTGTVTVTGSGSCSITAGGVVGLNNGSKVENCYHTGDVTVTDSGSNCIINAGGVAGDNYGSVNNCYFLQTDNTLSGIGYDGSSNTGAEGKTEDAFASGEVAYLLSGGDTQDSNSPWRQNLGSADADGSPVLDSTHARVYYDASSGTYTNFEVDTDGYYQIKTAEDLAAFAALVNSGKTSINAKLMDNIDLSTVCGENLNGGTSWTPIGKDDSHQFKGTFDGQGHTVSGLYVNMSNVGYAGLFGYVGRGGTVKNLKVEGMVTAQSSNTLHAGGVAGCACDESTVANCSFSGSVTGNGTTNVDVGGVVGRAANYGITVTTVQNCSSFGSVSGTGNNSTTVAVGGVVGFNFGTVRSCYSTSAITASSGKTIWQGGVVGGNSGSFAIHGTVSNCYFLQDQNINNGLSGVGYNNAQYGTVKNVEDKTAEQFASGEVAWLLQAGQTAGKEQVWGQTLVGDTKDTAPVLTSDEDLSVVKVTFMVKDEGGYTEHAAKYTNKSGTVTLPEEPTSGTYAFVKWSQSADATGETFDATTEVTEDITVYAVGSEKFGGETEPIAVSARAYLTTTVDLSAHMAYAGETGAAGKFTYTIASGNDSGYFSIDGDNLIIKATKASEYTLTITAKEQAPQISLFSISSYDTSDVTLTVTVTVTNLFATGDGTEQSPYEIPDLATLENFRDYVNAGYGANEYFKLTDDIDMSAKYHAADEESGAAENSWEPIGYYNSYTDKVAFQGTFNGNGKTIKGLYINRSQNAQGLFGYINGGTVENLALVACMVAGDSQIGGLVGSFELHSGRVENCSVSGTVKGNDNNIGGVVGMNGLGTVKNCSFNGTVTGSQEVGGVVGSNGGTVENCYHVGTVTANITKGGGVVGLNSGTVKNCYNTGAVTTTYDFSNYGAAVGGVVGSMMYGSVENCYHTGEITVAGTNQVYTGGVVGYKYDGTVNNCYFLQTDDVNSGLSGIGNDGSSASNTGAEGKTADKFASGEVAYLLQAGQTAGEDGSTPQVWGQALGTNGDATPVLTSDATKSVAAVTFMTKDATGDGYKEHAVKYTNKGGTVALPDDPDAPATHAFCGWYTSNTALTEEYRFTANTAVTADTTVYAGMQLQYGAVEGIENVTTTYGVEKTADLSKYIAYADSTATAKNFSYQITSGNTGNYFSIDGDTLTVSNTTPAGTYTLTITATEILQKISLLRAVNYGTVPVTFTVTVVVAKAAPEVTAPSAKELTYTGEAQALVTAGSATGGTIQYSTDGTNYSTAIPTGTDAGTYTVYYKVVGDGNHNDTTAESVTVTIAKATPAYVAPTGLTAVSGQTLASVKLPSGWAWDDGTQSVGSENTYKATFTPEDTVNYSTVTVDITITIVAEVEVKPGETVEIGDTTVTNNDGDTVTVTGEDGTEITVTLPEGSDSVTVDGDGNVTVPDGTTVRTGDGPEITLPDGGTVGGDGNVTGKEVQIGDTTITAPEGETVTTTPDGTTTAPGGSTVTTGGTTITIGEDTTATVDENGNITLPEGGTATIETKDGEIVTITVPTEGGEITVNKGEGETTITAPDGATVQTGDGPEITLPSGGTIDGDGNVTGEAVQIGDTTITAPEGKTVTTTPDGTTTAPSGSTVTTGGTDITIGEDTTATVDENGNITLPDGGTATVETKDGKPVTITAPESGGTISVGEDGSITLPGGSTVTVGGKTTNIPTSGGKLDPAAGTVTVNSSGGSGSSVPTYPPTVEKTDNGSVSITPTSPKQGATVTVTPKPETGYEVDIITVTDKNGNPVQVTDKGNGTYSFTQPAGRVTVKVTFAETKQPAPDLPFTDVDPAAWYAEAVRYMLERGLMTGTAPDTFSPDSATTRAMVVTILYRLEGEPGTSGNIAFTDVERGTWYTDAIAWAAANGVVTGTSPTTFEPDAPVTREQMAAILYRYLAAKGYDVTAQADLSAYTDAGQISPYATETMSWANAVGLLTGETPTTLVPQGNATRAQVATILMRFCEGLEK